MVKRIQHTVNVNGVEQSIRLPDLYDKIGNIVGVKKVGTDDQGKYQTGDVDGLLRAGQIIKLTLSIKVTASNKRRRNTIICDLDNVKSAIGALPGKTYNGGEIIDAYFPTRRRLG